MPAVRWRKNPIEFDAIQFTGESQDNWMEVSLFCGSKSGSSGLRPAFTTILAGDILRIEHPEAAAKLWVEANRAWIPVARGEWIIRDSVGLYPCKDEIMQKNNQRVDESTFVPVTWMGIHDEVLGRAEMFDGKIVIVVKEDYLLTSKYNRTPNPLMSMDQIRAFGLSFEYKPAEEAKPNAG